MHRLILLRHAKSDWPDGVPDRERPLAKRGLRDAPRMAAALAARGLKPDLVLISTARRTRQTWSLIKPAFYGVRERLETPIYEAPAEVIIDCIRSIDPEVETLMVVGHNPGLEDAAGILTSPSAVADAVGEKFPTTGMLVITFASGGWSGVGAGTGEIALFLKPAMLDE